MTITSSVCPQHRTDSGIWRAPRRPAVRWLCFSPTYGFRGTKGSTFSRKRAAGILRQDVQLLSIGELRPPVGNRTVLRNFIGGRLRA